MEFDQWQQMFTVLARTEIEMKRSSLSRAVFEMALLRVADVRPFKDIDALITAINKVEPEPETKSEAKTETVASEPPLPVITPEKKSFVVPETQVVKAVPVVAESQGEGVDPAKWGQIQQVISDKKSYFAHYLTVCDLVELSDNVIHLRVSDPYTKELMGKEENLSVIRAGVQTVCKRDVKVELSLPSSDAEKPVQDNKAEKKTPTGYNEKAKLAETEIIQEALEIFGGVVTR